MSMKKLLRNQKGFSLIELLIVIGIMAILATILIPRFMSSSEDAKEATNTSNVKMLQSAIERYHFEKGLYPIGDDTSDGSETISADGTTINQNILVKKGYISQIAEDPWKTDTTNRPYTINTKGVVQPLTKPSSTTS